jgi:hypothetical protein
LFRAALAVSLSVGFSLYDIGSLRFWFVFGFFQDWIFKELVWVLVFRISAFGTHPMPPEQYKSTIAFYSIPAQN